MHVEDFLVRTRRLACRRPLEPGRRAARRDGSSTHAIDLPGSGLTPATRSPTCAMTSQPLPMSHHPRRHSPRVLCQRNHRSAHRDRPPWQGDAGGP